jgi:sugar lactone lactonase YvrE
VLFADAGTNAIREFTPDATVTTKVGLGAHPGNVNGTGAAARFNNPEPLAVDASGNLYLSDSNGLRKVTPGGVVSTAFSGGGGSTGLAIDAAGNAYFSQPGLNAIYKVSGSGAPVLFAGSGTVSSGDADGTGSAAGFNHPNGIAIDAAGNLFVVDTGNYTIRMITPAAVVTTLAGLAGDKGITDGTGSAAQFWAPFAIAVDGTDTLYVTDGNAIRKVTAGGAVTTLAGSIQTQGYADGTGSAALFNSPAAIAIGPSGSLLVADSTNNVIREVSAAGAVTTAVGIAGKAGVSPGPLPTTINVPVGLLYIWPNLYVTDTQENSVLAVSGIF